MKESIIVTFPNIMEVLDATEQKLVRAKHRAQADVANITVFRATLAYQEYQRRQAEQQSPKEGA